jgi:hypothetical protein
MLYTLAPYRKVEHLPMVVGRSFDGIAMNAAEPAGLTPRRRRLLYEQRYLTPAQDSAPLGEAAPAKQKRKK